MPVILGANSASGGYEVTNSLRFNSGSSDDLSRTPASAGNRRTFTTSFWVKRSYVGSNNERIFHALGNTNRDGFLFQADNFRFFIDGGTYNFTTNQVFRDVSAWYHFVITVDTTQSTSSNRIKIYVNGSQITSFSAEVYPTQNFDMNFNTTTMHRIGRDASSNTEYMNGYLSEFYFIDGQALTPSSFGETDEDSGIWKPKAYTGTYGTNGFYLQFKNSSSLGTDSSGNGNTFTVNNLTSIDQTTDTPTNNFCTWNGVNIFNGTSTSRALTEGNLAWTSGGTGADGAGCMSTFAVSSGKWYAEIKVTVYNQFTNIGVAPPEIVRSSHGSSSTDYIGYESDGTKYIGSTSYSYGSSYTNGDIIGIALNMDSSQVTFYKNGTSQGAISITSGKDYAILVTTYNGATNQANFGSPMYSANSYTDGAGYGNFSYSVPSGYYALCTKNLANFG